MLRLGEAEFASFALVGAVERQRQAEAFDLCLGQVLVDVLEERQVDAESADATPCVFVERDFFQVSEGRELRSVQQAAQWAGQLLARGEAPVGVQLDEQVVEADTGVLHTILVRAEHVLDGRLHVLLQGLWFSHTVREIYALYCAHYSHRLATC